MRKIIIYVILVAVLIVNAYGLSMTYFNFNQSNVFISENTSINITLPGNVSISSATLSIKGSRWLNITNSYQVYTSPQPYDISLVPGTNEFFATNGGEKIYRLNSTGGIINNFSITNDHGINFVFPSLSTHDYYGIEAINNDTFYAVNYDNSGQFHFIVLCNFSLGIKSTNACLDYINITSLFRSSSIPRGLYVDRSEQFSYVTSEKTGTNYVYKINITKCENSCRTSYNFSTQNITASRSYMNLDSNDNGSTFYATSEVTDRLYYLNSSFSELEWFPLNQNSLIDAYTIRDTFGHAYNGTTHWIIDTYNTNELDVFSLNYPEDILLKTGNTVVFNNTDLLSGTNYSININLGNVLETCYASNTICQLNIGANHWGQLNISNLSISYTKLLKLNIFDEETKALVSDEMTVTMVSGTYSHNYTFTGGRINITDIPDEYMEINYGGSGYATRAYFVNINTYQVSLDLYTIHNSSSTLVIFSVPDEKGFPLYNGTITVQRYYVDTGLWTDLCMERIDDNGESGIFLVPNDVYYKFIVQKNGVVLGTFGPRKVFSNSIELPVSTIINQLQSLAAQRDSIATSMVWDNATNIITYSFADASRIVTQGCIEVSEKSVFNEITYGPECTSGTSGSAVLDMSASIHNNSVYTVKGYVMTTTVYSEPITNIIHKQFNLGYEKFGKAGLYLAYLFIGTMFFLGITMSFSIALIYSVLAMVAIQLIGISFFGWAFIVTITIIGMTIAWVNRI